MNQTLDSLVSLVQTRAERDELQSSIRHLLDEVSEVAAGDLTVEAQVSAGPTGAIADSFNYMIEELRGSWCSAPSRRPTRSRPRPAR